MQDRVGPSLVAPVLPLLLAAAAWAQPALDATLDLEKGELSLHGAVRCEGEKVTGRLDIAVAAGAGTAPRLQAGGKAPGRFRVTVELTGTRDAGGELLGAARLGGTFTTEAGCEAALSGEGTFTGTHDEPAGTIEIRAAWEKVAYDKCSLLSPQPLTAASLSVSPS